jgi:hypothetical protein
MCVYAYWIFAIEGFVVSAGAPIHSSKSTSYLWPYVYAEELMQSYVCRKGYMGLAVGYDPPSGNTSNL